MEKEFKYDNLNPECELILIREARKSLLIEADHLVNLALDSEVEITPFRQYRQQLRDITQTYKTLKDVVWPQKPSLPQASA
ncbi:phage tail assembly chaperone [Vibrio splendidus]